MRVNLSGLSIEIQNCCCIITLFHWEISLLSKIDAHMLEHFAIRTERMGEVPLSTFEQLTQAATATADSNTYASTGFCTNFVLLKFSTVWNNISLPFPWKIFHVFQCLWRYFRIFITRNTILNIEYDFNEKPIPGKCNIFSDGQTFTDNFLYEKGKTSLRQLLLFCFWTFGKYNFYTITCTVLNHTPAFFFFSWKKHLSKSPTFIREIWMQLFESESFVNGTRKKNHRTTPVTLAIEGGTPLDALTVLGFLIYDYWLSNTFFILTSVRDKASRQVGIEEN